MECSSLFLIFNFFDLVSMTVGRKSARNRIIFWKCSKKNFIIKFRVWKCVSVWNLAFKNAFWIFWPFWAPLLTSLTQNYPKMPPEYIPKIGHWGFFDREGSKGLKNSKTGLSWKNALKVYLAAPLEEINWLPKLWE